MARPKSKPKQQANGRGSVSWSERHNAWRVQATVGAKADGTPIRRERIVRGDEADAWRVLDEIQQTNGVSAAPRTGKMPTVAKLVDEWIAAKAPRWSAARVVNVTSHVKTTIKGDPIGRMAADRVTVDHVEAWLQRIAATREASTVRTYRGHPSAAYNWAIGRRNGAVSYNPFSHAEMPELPDKSEKGWLDFDQAWSLINHCLGSTNPWASYFVTCAMLGLRPGEGGGIRMDSVNFETGVVTINHGVKRRGNKAVSIGKTKTKKERRVTAPPEVLTALRKQLDAQEVARLVHGDVWPAEWATLMFVHPSYDRTGKPGYPPSSQTLRNALTDICAEVGVPRMTPYELRHSCASIMLDRGVPYAQVARALGTSEAMLRDHYDHTDPVYTEQADVWASVR